MTGRCERCGAAITYRREKLVIGSPVDPLYVETGRMYPADAGTRRNHAKTCSSRRRPALTIVRKPHPGTCGVCGVEHKRIRTADTGMTYCPPCYGLAKDGRLVAA
jgi:hypothetical protein